MTIGFIRTPVFILLAHLKQVNRIKQHLLLHHRLGFPFLDSSDKGGKNHRKKSVYENSSQILVAYLPVVNEPYLTFILYLALSLFLVVFTKYTIKANQSRNKNRHDRLKSLTAAELPAYNLDTPDNPKPSPLHMVPPANGNFKHVQEEKNDIASFSDEKHTVLVVEDDATIRNQIHTAFLNAGFQSVEASNGEHGLTLLEKYRIDVVISDVRMSEMNGLELCRRIRQDVNYRHLPIILLIDQAEEELKVLENGAYAILVEPFKWKQMLLVTKTLVDLQDNLKRRIVHYPFEEPAVLNHENKHTIFIKRLVQTIETRISDTQLSVEVLSQELGLSRSGLYKKVKETTGQVPNEFIRLVRLEHAARLLLTRDYSISEVGYMVGFNSHSYFSKCFFNQFQLTPTEFAEHNKRN